MKTCSLEDRLKTYALNPLVKLEIEVFEPNGNTEGGHALADIAIVNADKAKASADKLDASADAVAIINN